MQRLRNELFVWTSVERFYRLTPSLRRANRVTIRNLQADVGKDLVHRLRHGKPVPTALVRDIVSMAPSTLAVAPFGVLKALFSRLRARDN